MLLQVPERGSWGRSLGSAAVKQARGGEGKVNVNTTDTLWVTEQAIEVGRDGGDGGDGGGGGQQGMSPYQAASRGSGR